MNEPILLQNGTSGPRGNGMRQSTLRVMRPMIDLGQEAVLVVYVGGAARSSPDHRQ